LSLIGLEGRLLHRKSKKGLEEADSDAALFVQERCSGLEASGLEVIFTRYFTGYDVLVGSLGDVDFGHAGSISAPGVSCRDIEGIIYDAFQSSSPFSTLESIEKHE